ncbi:ferrous iron transport protein A [Patescibacteria group bacterium]|nr:ferrous iron transport protein A [Patescibacteria group bacterium]
MGKSLITFNVGETVSIRCVRCGRNFTKRLSDLGLFDGALVTILKNDSFGPIILKVLGSKIALGRGEAEKIYGETK